MATAVYQRAACKTCNIVSSPSTPSWRRSAPLTASTIKPIPLRVLRFTATASSSAGDASAESGKEDDDGTDSKVGVEELSFEEKLAKLRRRSKSGTGVKAERRKARKAGDIVEFSSTPTRSKGNDNVLLPPVPLLDPISDGLRVEVGFNSYTERINGRFAALGLAAFLLVELATGSSFLKYHGSSVIGVQAYIMLAVSALFIKYEKEKNSIWPGPKS